jgi:ketosteroid isomerase-like protein
MKLTKKLEAEILKTYNSYWENYLKGDAEAMHPLLADEYTQVGSAESEVFSNKKDAVQFLYNTIDQVAGKLEMRNRKTILEQQENSILIHEFCDLYALANNNWGFYSKFRASTFMQQKKDGWKITHQHSSFPDTKAEDGQNIAIDKIAEENQQLREAVKRRTIELEQKNRELEIETTLERVRARTMAMQQSNELPEAANLLFQQVQLLGVPAWSAGYCIWDEDLPAGQAGKQGITLWMSSEGVMQPSFHAPLTKDPSFIHMREAYEKGQTFHVEEVGGKALVAHYKYMRTLPVVGTVLDSIIEAGHPLPTFQIFHCVYFSQGFLLFITYEPVPEAHEIFKRFGKVFDQTYTRFLDLQKAEAQAREAQIEAALERVRSRSMAMHKSEELREVIQLVFEQFRLLNFKIDSAQFDPNYKETDDFNMWTAVPGQPYPTLLHIPYLDNPAFNGMKEAKKRGLSFITQHLSFEEKNQFFRHFFQHFKHIPAERQKLIFDSPGIYRAVVFMENVSLAIQNYSNTAYTEEENDVLKRFGKTFEQVYIRLLDLQKAEAQAREAQIELALERVRARTMAMQHSDELRETVLVIYEQLQQLDFASHACNIIIIDKDTLDMQFWVSGFTKEIYPEIYHIPRLHHTYHEVQIAAWQQGVKYQVFEYSGKGKIDFDKIFFTKTEFKNVPEDAKKVMIELKSLKLSTAFFNYGALQVLGAEELSDDKAKTLQRFAKVFDQTYTRFLDLQKAEAQAREAQIEAALERVRSKTMAMHNSQDVGESVATLFVELVKMGLIGVDDRCGIGIMQPHEMMEAWTASKTQDGKSELTIGHINMTLHPLLVSAYGGWVEKKEFNQYILEGEDILRYYDAMRNQSNYKFKRDYFSQESRIVHTDFYFSEGCLYVFSKNEFSANSNPVFLRFVNVFGQTYRRYLDLQKAETQAREATIEASLERVRGKAMAMHTSNDLLSTAGVVFTELKKLGINSFRGGVALIDKESRFAKMYSATSSEEGDMLSLNGTIVLDGHPILSKIWECMISQSDYFPVLKGELLESYITHVSAAFNSPLIKSNYDEWYGCFLPYSEGGFYVWSDKPFTESEVKILHRFNAIVDLTFRRYLELQRAEANALEAVRSASLDRVRAEIASMRTPLIWNASPHSSGKNLPH